MQHLTSLLLNLAERGLGPDRAIRRGIRHLLKQRLSEIQPGDDQSAALHEAQFIEQLRRAPVALVPEKANDQHYEVPVEFFQRILGKPFSTWDAAGGPSHCGSRPTIHTPRSRRFLIRTHNGPISKLRPEPWLCKTGCGW